MATAPHTRLRQMIQASKDAGMIIAAAKAEGDKIELVFETPKDELPADLINWKRRK